MLAYILADGRPAYEIGFDRGRPVARAYDSGGLPYQAMAGALDAGIWTHLAVVYYADEPQEVVVAFPWRVRARALSPDVEETPVLEGSSLTLSLDVYTVLLCES